MSRVVIVPYRYCLNHFLAKLLQDEQRQLNSCGTLTLVRLQIEYTKNIYVISKILQQLFWESFFQKKMRNRKIRKITFLPIRTKMIFSIISSTINLRHLGDSSKFPQKILQKIFYSNFFKKNKKNRKIKKNFFGLKSDEKMAKKLIGRHSSKRNRFRCN